MTTDKLYGPKELAQLLRRNKSYVYAMRRAGFIMPGGTATITEAREWLVVHPFPRRRKHTARPRQ